ncbi:hypothetical protein OAI33_13485 [Pirellulaceae bacterium]|nr:hypothetical protein [Pirellulaceae bacterium]
MDIKFSCQKCGKVHTVPAELAGKKSKCACGAIFTIPQSDIPVSSQASSARSNEAAEPTPPTGSPQSNSLGQLPTPPIGNPFGAMPPAQPDGNPLGGPPVGGAFPPAPGASPLGGMPAGTLGMQPAAGRWNTPASLEGQAKSTKGGGSKKRLWIGISIGAVLLVGGGVTAFLLMWGGNSVEVASSNDAKPAVAEEVTTPFPKTPIDQNSSGADYSADNASDTVSPLSEMNESEVNGSLDGSSSGPEKTPSESANPFGESSATEGPSPFTDTPSSPMPTPEDAPSFVDADSVYSVIEKLEYPLPKFVGLEGGTIRTWGASTGDYTIEGVFDGLRIVNGEPEIAISSSGNEISLPKSKLRSEDRIWVTANGHQDFMAHAIQAAKNVEEKYRRYTPDDFESPCPFDVDWVTGIPELWGPVYDVDLVVDAKRIAEGYYNGKYIRLNGFLEPRDEWAVTNDGQGRISILSKGSKSLRLIWDKDFVDTELGGYTREAMYELVINRLVRIFPGLISEIDEKYGAAGLVVFFEKVLPIYFDMHLVGKLDESGSFVYAQEFVLKLKNVWGEPQLYGRDEFGYRGVFEEELRRWLALIKTRVMETADPNGDGTIHSEEHAIGYYEDAEGSGVNIDSLISSLRSLAALNALNVNMNKFSRLVCQFKQVDQNNDGRLKIDDYVRSFWHETTNLEIINEAITLTEEHREGLRLLVGKGVRPKLYPRFVKTFKKAMFHLELHVRSKELTITSNPYLNKKPSEMREILDSRGTKQADFGFGVFDLLLRRETTHFQSLLASPVPVGDVLQYSDFSNEGHYFKAYVGQKDELSWLIAHINLMDTKLVEILPLQTGRDKLPAGKGHIYRFAGPYGTLNLWVDGILEKNYNLRAIFWDHAVNPESSEHLWIWKEGNIEKYARGKLTNVYWRENKMMLVIQTDEGETVGVPMYQMPQETQRFARWALAYLRTDKLYKDRGITEGPKIALAVEENTVSTSSSGAASTNQIIAMADTRYIGDRNGKSSHIEIMVAYYYDNVKNVQFDEKEVEKDGIEVYSETVALSEENTGDLFLYNLPEYGGEEEIRTEDVYRNEGIR